MDNFQSDLGERVSIHFTHLNRNEPALSWPTAHASKRLADALAVSRDYLLEGKTDEAAEACVEDRERLDAFLTKGQIQSLAAR